MGRNEATHVVAEGPSLPSGTVAFLFTDVEGSTRRWQQDTRTMAVAMARHDELLRAAIAAHDGYVFKTVGDAFCAAFATVPPAVAAALDAQRALAAEPWGAGGEIRVRMGIHVGDADERDADYFGPAVNRVARLMAAGHGGQILLSLPAAELARDSLPATTQLLDLGEQQLKDLTRPEHIFQLAAADLPTEFPPLRTLDNHPNNLPPQLTTLVGREREVAAVRALLVRPDVRLVTLTGPGGTGKTRLGLQVGIEVVTQYPDGVWFVALEKATEEPIVVSALAQALAVREVPGQPLLEAVIEFLRGKSLLLLLDNYEQVVHTSPLVARLLSEAPEIVLLVTSRLHLGLRGEHEYAVPPLDVPPDAAKAPPELLGCSAVRLFVERAQAAKGDFALSDDNAATVVEITRRLDGLPLAIELAAARIKVLPPRAMLARLENRLNLLTGGGRDRPERQQTLRGAIAWSYDLLSQEEQTLFARLSVCAAGCVFEVAELVGNLDGTLDLLSALESLVDHSLVQQREDADGEPRFTMLSTIRDYARERLAASGEADALHERHAAWCLATAEEAEPALLGPAQGQWLERLERERDNLRAALTWTIATDHGEEAIRLAGALARFWEMRGYPSEGRPWLEAALAHGAGTSPAARAKALRGLGFLLIAQAEYEAAAQGFTEGLALARSIGDRRGTADALVGLGYAVLEQHDYPRAIRLCEEALALFEAIGNIWGIAVAKNGLAIAAQTQGDITRAEALYTESLALFRSLGNQRDAAKTLNNLANVAQDRGDYARALELYAQSLALTRALNDKRTSALILYNQGLIDEDQGEFGKASERYLESITLFRNLGNRLSEAFLLLGLGLIGDHQGEHAQAAEMLDKSLALFRAVGDKRGMANALDGKAIAVRHQGDVQRAGVLLQESLALRQEIGDRQGIVESLGGLAAVAAQGGAAERAVRLYAAEMTIRAEIGSPRTLMGGTEHDGILARARLALGDAAFAAAWAAGEALTQEEAIAEALRLGAAPFDPGPADLDRARH